MTQMTTIGSINSTTCCGVKEYKGINYAGWTPRKAICRILSDVQWKKPPKGQQENCGHAAYIFTMAWETKNERPNMLDKLEEFVTKRNLGTITMAKPGLSGLYGGHHTIQVGVFTPNRDGMIEWARKKEYFPKDFGWVNYYGSGTLYGNEFSRVDI